MDKFSSRKKVVHWLQGQGYKISVPRIYQDVKKGLLVLEPDGSVLPAAVDRYIKTAGLQKPAAETVESSIHTDRKQKEELRQLELKNAKLQHEIDIAVGRYVPKSQADSDMADLAALLDALPRHTLLLNLPKYLAAIGADPTKAALFFSLFDHDFTSAVNQICDDGRVDLLAGDDPLTGGDSANEPSST